MFDENDELKAVYHELLNRKLPKIKRQKFLLGLLVGACIGFAASTGFWILTDIILK